MKLLVYVLIRVHSIPMAFNPATYEQPYGFEMLDELHNFFPEFIYDDTIFPSPMVQYAQHRMRTLFSPTYARQQHLYNIYASGPRRAQFLEWQRTQQRQQRTPPVRVSMPVTAPGPAPAPAPVGDVAPAPAPVIAPAPAPVGGAAPATQAHTTFISEIARGVWGPMVNTGGLVRAEPPASIRPSTTTTTDSEMSSAEPHTPPAQRRVHAPRNEYIIARDVPIPTIASLLNEATFETNLLQLLASPLEFQFVEQRGLSDVEVVPTSRQVDNGSVLLEGLSVIPDTNCAICQEHQFPGATAPTQWRRLYCTHQFHRECIDSWFIRSVFCPVCRADIRDAPRPHVQPPTQPPTQPAPRPASSSTTSALPNQTSGMSWAARVAASPPSAGSVSISGPSATTTIRPAAVAGVERLRVAAARAAAEENDGTDGDHEGQGDDTENDI